MNILGNGTVYVYNRIIMKKYILLMVAAGGEVL